MKVPVIYYKDEMGFAAIISGGEDIKSYIMGYEDFNLLEIEVLNNINEVKKSCKDTEVQIAKDFKFSINCFDDSYIKNIIKIEFIEV